VDVSCLKTDTSSYEQPESELKRYVKVQVELIWHLSKKDYPGNSWFDVAWRMFKLSVDSTELPVDSNESQTEYHYVETDVGMDVVWKYRA